MKLILQLIASVAVVALVVEQCSAIGLLSGLGLGNPMMSPYAMSPYGGYGAMAGMGKCGCGCPAGGLGLSLAHKLAISKVPSLGLGCPSTCCLIHSKPCLFTKLLLLKKKLLEKKMYKGCCGMGAGMGCGMGCGCM